MIGTLNELTIAYDEKKIIGLLIGTGGASDLFTDVLKKLGKSTEYVISSDNPYDLIEKIIRALDSIFQ